MSELARSPAGKALILPGGKSKNFGLGSAGQILQAGHTMNMNEFLKLPVAKLKRILALKTKIERLQARLENMAGAASSGSVPKPARKRRRMSASARKRNSIAAKARWAKVRAAKAK